jgi:penicillin-binding protein 1B
MKLIVGPITRIWSPRRRFHGLGIFPGLPRLEAAFLAAELAILIMGICTFVHFSRGLHQFMDARLGRGGPGGPAVILAAPAQVWVGQPADPATLEARLRNALYAEAGSDVGTFRLATDRLQIYPGTASFFRHGPVQEGPAELRFRHGRISSIRSLDGRAALESYWLEPEVITTLSGYARSEQHLVRYQDVPKVLLDAVIATEDHRFFSHHGVNFVRLVRAALADLHPGRQLQGGSTLTMQLARDLFLTRRRTIPRKMEEIGLALFLETRLNKQQIFELYANRVYLGQEGNFGIFGFRDAAQAYFHKDIGKLSLPEAAFLAGLIRGPNLYSPYRYPERALERRNFVLRQMVDTGFIQPAEAEHAGASPLEAAKPAAVEARQEAFFEDMVLAQLHTQFSERELHFDGLRVYTTLDLDLQRAASEGTRIGSAELDQQVEKQNGRKRPGATDSHQPQLALIAVDPHTGDVKALIGGRDYAVSQLNHILARRQPGSSFKPFVYAAALSSGVDGSTPVITPATLLNDEPTQFRFGNAEDELYQPKDYKESYHGTVTVRQALMESLNVPTVSLAQRIGYDKVRNLAMAAGFNSQVEATPSIALGAYVATPLEVAGAYTIFANQGTYVVPRWIVEIDDASGATVWSAPTTTRPVLDPRVACLMVSLLESVIDGGTGAGVRARGFTLPAAGKTGTSHDGWFAGFTSNLLVIVWVGYDDDRDLDLTGAQSALPIWTEFMKRAMINPSYRNAQAFAAPPGVVSVPIEMQASSPDTDTGADTAALATTRDEVFIKGTEPLPSSQGETPTNNDSQLLATSEIPQALDGPPSEGNVTPIAATPTLRGPGDTPPPERTGPATAPADRAGWGHLRIQSDPPGLEVFVDGRSVGPSPVTVSIPVGAHTYKVAPPPGRASAESTVRVTASAVATVHVRY